MATESGKDENFIIYKEKPGKPGKIVSGKIVMTNDVPSF